MIVRRRGIRQGAAASVSNAYDDFSGSGALNSSLWNFEDHSGTAATVVTVTRSGGKYDGAMASGNANPSTWFNADQGLHHYFTCTGDFEFIARSIGVADATTDDFQAAFVQIWGSDHVYEFVAPGNFGTGRNQILECKINDATGGGDSETADVTSALTGGLCDLRVQRVGSTVSWYRQGPTDGTATDSWTDITSSFTGMFKSRAPFGTGAVRVCIGAYGFETIAACTAEILQVELPTGTAVV